MKANFILSYFMISLAMCGLGSFQARAEIAGFEQLTEVSISCPATPIPPADEKVCSYKNIKCKLMDKGEFVFHGFVTIDCEKPSMGSCPEIEVCAKAKLRPEVAEGVRQRNDPNNDFTHEDGHNDPLAKERSETKERAETKKVSQ